MRHVVYALFHDPAAADAALSDLTSRAPTLRDRIGLLVHRDATSGTWLDESIQEATGSSEHDGGHGVAIGATLGLATGAALGALMTGPFGLLALGPLAAVLFGAGTGGVYGALSAGLVGVGLTDHDLRRLSDHITAGDVLVTVESSTGSAEREVDAVLRSYGARVVHRHLLR